MYTKNLGREYTVGPKKGQQVAYKKSTSQPLDGEKEPHTFHFPASAVVVPQFGNPGDPQSVIDEVIQELGVEWLANKINDARAADALQIVYTTLGSLTTRDGKTDTQLINEALAKAEAHSYTRITVKERNTKVEDLAKKLNAGELTDAQAAEMLKSLFK